MLAETELIESDVQDWLAAFEHALGCREEAALAALFDPDGYWRDAIAFTWDIGTVHGRDAIAAALKAEPVEATGLRSRPTEPRPARSCASARR